MTYSLKKIYFLVSKKKHSPSVNERLPEKKNNKSYIICNNCNNLKHQRYIFENKENNQQYCLTCLKNKFFFLQDTQFAKVVLVIYIMILIKNLVIIIIIK